MLDLYGTWTLADERGEYSLSAAAPGDPGRFSTNAVTRFPGHPAEIAFTQDDDPNGTALAVRDLHSSHGSPR